MLAILTNTYVQTVFAGLVAGGVVYALIALTKYLGLVTPDGSRLKRMLAAVALCGVAAFSHAWGQHLQTGDAMNWGEVWLALVVAFGGATGLHKLLRNWLRDILTARGFTV